MIGRQITLHNGVVARMWEGVWDDSSESLASQFHVLYSI